MGRSSVPGRRSRVLTLPIFPRQSSPSTRMSHLVMYPANGEHINPDGVLCVHFPLDISWITIEDRKMPLEAETMKTTKKRPFSTHVSGRLPEDDLYASIRICTRAGLMKHRKHTGRGGQSSAFRHVHETYTQLRVFQTLFMYLDPRR